MAQLISAQSITRFQRHGQPNEVSVFPLRTITLPATSFTRQELATIQRSPIQVLLTAMGFNRKMPIAVVWGIASLGASIRRRGLRQDLSITQNIRQHGRFGQMIWIVIQWIQVTTGVSESWRFLSSAVGKWFTSVHNFLADSDCTLAIDIAHTQAAFVGSTIASPV
jgi:hypothetical protein